VVLLSLALIFASRHQSLVLDRGVLIQADSDAYNHLSSRGPIPESLSSTA